MVRAGLYLDRFHAGEAAVVVRDCHPLLRTFATRLRQGCDTIQRISNGDTSEISFGTYLQDAQLYEQLMKSDACVLEGSSI